MDVTSDGAAETPVAVGAQLRAAREQQGQSLEDIGRLTRVPVRHLVQIEEGRLEGLPAAPYSAGFVKAYARAVGLDPVVLSHDFREEFDNANRNTPRIAYAPYEPADPVRLPPRLLAIVASGDRSAASHGLRHLAQRAVDRGRPGRSRTARRCW